MSFHSTQHYDTANAIQSLLFSRANFENNLERGGAFSVYHKGELVVNLYGGFANEKVLQPWTENMVTKMYSTSKGIGAIVMGILVDRCVLIKHVLFTTICKRFTSFKPLLSGIYMLFMTNSKLNNNNMQSQTRGQERTNYSPCNVHNL